MDKKNKQGLTQVQQLQEDMKSEWWKATEIDDFSLRQKLLRVGCRPLKRKFLACKTMSEDAGDFDVEMYANCKVSRNC